jgi:parallel beta-helix repeat protein
VRARRGYLIVAAMVLASAVVAAPASAATTLPSAPRTPKATTGNARATISWVKPLYDRGLAITSYLVTGKNVATGAATTPVSSTSTSVTITGLQNGKTYGFKIAARNSTGTGPTTAQVNVKVGLPAVVASATAAGDITGVRVSWSAPAANAAPIIGYRVTPYRNGKASTAKYFASTATQQTMTGLAPGSAYSYTVEAKNSLGFGTKSTKSNAIVVALPADAPPVSVTCTRSIAAGSSISSGVSGLVAGETLCLRGGVYTQTVTIARSGTSNAPIVIASQPGETAIIDGSGVSLGSTGSVVRVTGSYVTLANIEVRNSSGRGITIEGTGDRVSGTSVHNIQYNGILAGGSNQRIDNNEVWNTVLSNTNASMGSSGWAEAVNTWRASNTTINNNDIHDNWGEGIDFISSNGGFALSNRVVDNFSTQIYVDGTANVIIHGNFLASTSATYDRSGLPTGVLMARESGGSAVNGITITNNTFQRTSGIKSWLITPTNVTNTGNTFLP